MPPSLLTTENRSTELANPRLTWTVRLALLLVLGGLLGMFGVAFWLNPYDAEGEARLTGTHRQLGLPACTFKVLAGKPCPSCGLTTSITLFAHGDVRNSLRANWVGTLLAVFALAVLVWGGVSLARNRYLGIRSPEMTLSWVVSIFLVLLLVRWAFVLGPVSISRW